MKKCTICKIEKENTEFNKNKVKKDGLNTICRECSNRVSKNYYILNKENHIKKVGERNKQYRNKIHNYILDLFKEKGCKDCGIKDTRVLEFDHLPNFEKVNNISSMVTYSLSLVTIKKEIEKCDIVCANCHRIRTVERNEKNYRKLL